MKTNRTLLVISACTLFLFSLVLSSCKDDTPPAKPKLSFAKSTMTAKESDGDIEVKLKLDKATPERISITYELDGTATDYVSDPDYADYKITSDYLEAIIEKGDSIALIKIKLYSDFDVEGDETIQISIKDVDSENIEITRDDLIKVTVQQEDGMVVLLKWPAASSTAGGADMDIILRVGASTSTWDGILTGSAYRSTDPQEYIFLPYVLDYTAYGLSYVYYDGTMDPLAFTVTFIDFVNGTSEPAAQQQTFNQTYTKANLNKWTSETLNSTIVVQTFQKSGSAFATPTQIDLPPAGSRVNSSSQILPSFRLVKHSDPNAISQFLNK